jgi:hypothetical protein
MRRNAKEELQGKMDIEYLFKKIHAKCIQFYFSNRNQLKKKKPIGTLG